MLSVRPRAGFSLITTMIAVVIFAMLGVAAYNLEVASTKALRAYREKEDIAALADQYMEIARNLPYSEVGTVSGNPHGILADQPNQLNLTYNGTKYQLYYVVNYVSDPAASTTDSGDEDYKQVKVYIQNPVDGLVVPFETNVVPLGSAVVSGGALSLQVINANGQPVPGATLTITDASITPAFERHPYSQFARRLDRGRIAEQREFLSCRRYRKRLFDGPDVCKFPGQSQSCEAQCDDRQRADHKGELCDRPAKFAHCEHGQSNLSAASQRRRSTRRE